jgi:hypothetical protein
MEVFSGLIMLELTKIIGYKSERAGTDQLKNKADEVAVQKAETAKKEAGGPDLFPTGYLQPEALAHRQDPVRRTVL